MLAVGLYILDLRWLKLRGLYALLASLEQDCSGMCRVTVQVFGFFEAKVSYVADSRGPDSMTFHKPRLGFMQNPALKTANPPDLHLVDDTCAGATKSTP